KVVASSVEPSIGSLNVALMFPLIATLVAPSAGLMETTEGTDWPSSSSSPLWPEDPQAETPARTSSAARVRDSVETDFGNMCFLSWSGVVVHGLQTQGPGRGVSPGKRRAAEPKRHV